jgi:hypothetical protein
LTIPSRKLGSKVLTVIVGTGEHKREFAVHEGLITASSEFFRKAMSGTYMPRGLPHFVMRNIWRPLWLSFTD